MSILFIDTGWKDLGFAIFNWDGEPLFSSSITICNKIDSEKCDKIVDELDWLFLWAEGNTGGIHTVVYENYTVRPDDGKSIKGQKTLKCNGIVEGFARCRKKDVDEQNNGHWKAIYSRYKLDHTLKGLAVLTPPKSANDHACDAFKMGVAWFVERGIIK